MIIAGYVKKCKMRDKVYKTMLILTKFAASVRLQSRVSPTSLKVFSFDEKPFCYNNSKAGALEVALEKGISWPNQEPGSSSWQELCEWAPESTYPNALGLTEPWPELLEYCSKPSMCIGFVIIDPASMRRITIADNTFSESDCNGELLRFHKGMYTGKNYPDSPMHPHRRGLNAFKDALQKMWSPVNDDIRGDSWENTDEIFVPFEGKLVHLKRTDILST